MTGKRLLAREMHEPHCTDCRLADLCLPMGLTNAEIERLDGFIKRGKSLAKGEVLFRQGQPGTSLYAVRSGALKTFSLSEAGVEQVTGFHLPSEIVGLAVDSDERLPVSAVALETTFLCEIPLDMLDNLSNDMAHLRKRMLRLMSREIRDNQQMLLVLSKKNAEQRLATLLVNLSARHQARGYSATAFRLVMSRHEIGNFLGLALETVSRVLNRFQQHGLIQIDNKDVRILRAEEIYALADGLTDHSSD